jgi:hypothetical protein
MMSRRILVFSLFMGAILAALLVSGQKGWAERPTRVTNPSLTVLHLPSLATVVSVARTDDNPCEDNDEQRQRDPRIRRGFEITPVTLNLEGKNCALVGLGSYLVNAVGGCNDCHTNPSYMMGGDPFKGEPKQVNTANYMAGGRPFGPIVKSRNITPLEPDGHPANLTFEQFLETMRTGKDFKNLHPQLSPLLQVMPWPAYQDMTRRDIRAMYEYLSAIPHADPAT